MRTKIVSLLVAASYLHSTVTFAGAINIGLSEKQKDEIIALDIIEKNPKAAEQLTAIGIATHYASNNNLGIRDFKDLNQVSEYSISPFSAKTYELIFGSRKPAPVTHDEYVKNTAKKVYEEVTFDLRNDKKFKTMDLSVNMGLALAGTDKRTAPFAAVGKVGWEHLKEDAIEETSKQTRMLPNSHSVKVETLTRMQNEIRKQSPEGKAYAEMYKTLSKDDPTVPSDQKSVVLDGAARIKILSANKNNEKALMANGEIQKALTDFNQGVAHLRQEIVDLQAEKDPRANQAKFPMSSMTAQEAYDKKIQYQVRNLQNARGTLMVASYMMTLSGNHEGARVVMQTAEMADKVSNLLANAAEMAPAMLAAGWVGVAIMAVSLIQKSQQPESPYPAIFAMLQQISKQIIDMRQDVLNAVSRMDNRLGNMLMANLELSEAIKQNTDAMRDQLNKIQDQLQETRDTLTRQNVAIVNMFMSAEDRACLRFRNRQLLEPQPDFLRCQAIYQDRATVISKDIAANTQISDEIESPLAEARGAFPFGSRYQTLQKDLKLARSLIANPNVWFASVGRYLTMLDAFPKYIDDIELVGDESDTLDPMIKTGADIRDFLLNLAFDKSQPRALKTKNFEELTAEIKQIYLSVLGELNRQLRATGVRADITKDSDKQVVDAGFQHAFLSGSNVGFCNYKDGGIKVRSLIGYTQAVSGRGGGREIYITGEDARWGVEYAMRSHSASEFQPDVSLVPVIYNAVRLSEILPNGTPIRVCLQTLEISNLVMTPQSNTSADIRLLYYVSAMVDGKMSVVQTLEGTQKISAAYFNYHYCPSQCETRHAQLAQTIAQGLRGNYGKFLKATPFPNNLRALTDEVNYKLRQKREDLRRILVYKTQSDRLEQLRTNLSMLAAIGLNMQHKNVYEVYRDLNDPAKLPTVSAIVDEAVLKGRSLKEINDQVNAEMAKLMDKIKKLSALGEDILPSTHLLDLRLNQLKVLKDLRGRHRP